MQLKLKAKLTLYALFGKLVRSLLGPHAIAILVRTSQGSVFAVDPEDNGVGGALRRRGHYGQGEMEHLSHRITSQSRVLVVGSHVGTLVVNLAALCREVVALEANPATFELLKMNLALNGVKNCRAIQLAAAEENKPIDFIMSRDNSGGSKRMPRKGGGYLYYYDRPRVVKVDAARLDDVFRDESFDVILMDIEGSEYFAFKGMPRLIQACTTLVAEFNPYNMKHVGGVGAEEFVAQLEPHFSSEFIPTSNRRVPRQDFRAVLSDMYRRGIFDEGLVFEKSSG